MTAAARDLSGQQFDRLTVVRAGSGIRRRRSVVCMCECGTEVERPEADVVAGKVRSCGCMRRERARALAAATTDVRRLATTKHGLAGTDRHPLYSTWVHMNQRCANPSNRNFADYGGRGITVCERWRGEHGFENFLADMGERPPGTTLDRRDNDRGYSPENCRWATRVEQTRNTRANRLITVDGETLTLAEWADRAQIPVTTLHHRLSHGWSEEAAVKTPRNEPHDAA